MTGIVFLEVSKAFDKVWNEGLVKKINQMGYQLSRVQLVDSYLTGKRFKVRIR